MTLADRARGACGAQVKQKLTISADFTFSGAAAPLGIPRGTHPQLLRNCWKSSTSESHQHSDENSERSLEAKFRGVCLPAVSLLRRGGRGGGKKNTHSSSSFCSSASSFDQAYSRNVALGATITPTQEGARKDASENRFFLPVLSVVPEVPRVLNNN